VFSFISLDLVLSPNYITCRLSGALPPGRSSKPAFLRTRVFGGDSRPAF
jgi:hypothetical protein